MVNYMKVDIVRVGYLKENCYILQKDKSVLIIDPGADADKIKEMIGNRKVVGILITHNHFDHVGALKEISEYYNVSFYNHDNLSEGIHSIEKFKFEVIYTPGHSADSVTYYFFDDKKMFAGDFIFRNDIGRCDLPTGDENEMLDSIIRIKKYENCSVYPGHGDVTTLDYERQNNQYFKIERV